MTIPHRFPSLIEGSVQVVLIAGTGLSMPNLPSIEGLKKNKLDKIARDLNLNQDSYSDFYDLAEAVLESLVAEGKSDSESRLQLAEMLGMLDDQRWFGEIGLPLSGNTPRHRAIARFVVENRLRAIVSLNWDTLLEAALDSVGITEGSMTPRPWKVTAYARVIDDTHLGSLEKANVFPVIKPHGCVRDLEQVRRSHRSHGTTKSVTLKVKKSELLSSPDGQKLVDEKVECCVAECPLIAVGWRASEKYLRDAVVKCAKAVKRTNCDAVTFVDICWNPNHAEIANAYGKENCGAFTEVKPDTTPTTDYLFQWLQARYALNKLIAVASVSHKTALQQLLQQIDQPDCDHHPILGWVDSWLPTWVRLCWRAGVMQGCDPYTNRKIESWEIPIMPRDVHVPLGTMTGDRRDLQAAARLLISLSDTLSQFNFDMFPGGLWHERKQCLYLPLPSWRGVAQHSNLGALKPQVEAMRRWGFVREIRLICLDAEDTSPDQILCCQLEAQVRNLIPLLIFASGTALSWVSLDALKGESYATMA